MVAKQDSGAPWTYSSKDEFYDYYAEQSTSPEATARAERTKAAILSFRAHQGLSTDSLRVLDIGCNAGAFSLPWARAGHTVVGIDINERLVALAQQRANEEALDVEFRVGSATELPVEAGSFDVCISPELLEHVAAWESCLDEFARALVPGGTLYLTTTNVLCPKQQEFSLPFYSWYPPALKRRCERLAVTTRPELANFATYPAVNWFSYYQLERELRTRHVECVDRFEMLRIKQPDAAGLRGAAIRSIGRSGFLRWLGHVCTPSTMIMATKRV